MLDYEELTADMAREELKKAIVLQKQTDTSTKASLTDKFELFKRQVMAEIKKSVICRQPHISIGLDQADTFVCLFKNDIVAWLTHLGYRTAFYSLHFSERDSNRIKRLQCFGDAMNVTYMLRITWKEVDKF